MQLFPGPGIQVTMLTTFLSVMILAGPTYKPTGMSIQFTMSSGKKFVITTDPKGSPKTSAQIISLVKKKFYDGIRIHRVEDWVVQWGDPVTKKGNDQPGAGSGGSGTPLPFEDNPASFLKGVVGIASTGAKLGGDSQLFVVLRDSAFLDHSYAIVGKVTSGMDVVAAFKTNDQIKNAIVLSVKKHK